MSSLSFHSDDIALLGWKALFWVSQASFWSYLGRLYKSSRFSVLLLVLDFFYDREGVGVLFPCDIHLILSPNEHLTKSISAMEGYGDSVFGDAHISLED